MNKLNSKKCICCKKNGHNITTCISAKKQGILIENHIQAFIMDICNEDDEKKKSRLLRYLRNLSSIQQKILSSRVGEKHLSCYNVFRYFVDKNRSKNVMLKLYGCTQNVLSKTLFSVSAEKIVCPSSSNKSEIKKRMVEDLDNETWNTKKTEFWKQKNILSETIPPAELVRLLSETSLH
jgi:hypothetical protein